MAELGALWRLSKRKEASPAIESPRALSLTPILGFTALASFLGGLFQPV